MKVRVDRDEELIRKIGLGSIDAFDQFYELHFNYVFTIALNLAKNPSEAEDLAHDVFIEVFKSSKQFDTKRGSVRAWLAIKTKSRFLDRRRRDKRSRDYIEKLETGGLEPAIDDVVLKRLDREKVLNALKQIPEQQKEALYGKYFNHQTQKELAALMDKPIGTIKSILRYGLMNLRKQLVKDGWSSLSGGDKHHE